MEQLIFVAIVAVASLVHGWWTKKRAEAEAEEERARQAGKENGRRPGAPSETASAPKPAPAFDWEEQLRRLLEGTLPTPPPQRPRPQPASAPAPTSVPPPLPPARPLPSPSPKQAAKPRPVPAAPPPVLARSAIPVPEEGMEMEVGLPVRPVTLNQAATAHERAQIQTNVTDRMQATSKRVIGHSRSLIVRAQSPMAVQVRGMLGSRASARATILASAILGPPRAIDPVP